MLKNTGKPGEYYDDQTDRTYMIYDQYPKVVTVTTSEEGYLLRPARGEQFILLGFACAADPIGEEGNLLVEVQRLRAFDVPIRVLRDAHERLQQYRFDRTAELLQVLNDQTARSPEGRTREEIIEESASLLAVALKDATRAWGRLVEEVRGPGLNQLITDEHECRLYHRRPERAFDLAPISIDIYMHVRRATTRG